MTGETLNRASSRDPQLGGGPLGRVAAVWALVGVSGLFGAAVFRLGRRGVDTIVGGLTPTYWGVLLALTCVMVYGEGILALQRRWVPKLIERARAVRGEPLWLQMLGPLYGLSLVGAPPKRVLRAWLGTSAIVAAVLIVRSLPEPWRGIVDFAVASALGWGLLMIVVNAPRAFRG